MNYFKFVKSDEQKNSEEQPKQPSQQETSSISYGDPIVRRYYYWKYFLQAAMLGTAVHATKLLVENLTKRRYKRLSPWLELAIASVYFVQSPLPHYDQLNEHILGSETEAKKKLLLESHKAKLYSNSQFWH